MSLTQASRDLLKREPPGVVNAVRALYRGLGLKLLRAVPSSAVNFSVYEWTKRRLERVLAPLSSGDDDDGDSGNRGADAAAASFAELCRAYGQYERTAQEVLLLTHLEALEREARASMR